MPSFNCISLAASCPVPVVGTWLGRGHGVGGQGRGLPELSPKPLTPPHSPSGAKGGPHQGKERRGWERFSGTR